MNKYKVQSRLTIVDVSDTEVDADNNPICEVNSVVNTITVMGTDIKDAINRVAELRSGFVQSNPLHSLEIESVIKQ